MNVEKVFMFPAFVSSSDPMTCFEQVIKPFAERLQRNFAGAIVVPLLYGDQPYLYAQDGYISSFKLQLERLGYHPLEIIAANKHGLAGVLRASYCDICKAYPKAIIIRIDPQGYPLDGIYPLIEEAMTDNAMIIGTSLRGNSCFTRGSAQEAADTWVMPDLFSLATGRPDLEFSSAHHLQIFPSGHMCIRIQEKAIEIMDKARKLSAGALVSGFDAAMILAAASLELSFSVNVAKVSRSYLKGVTVGNREPDEIRQQCRDLTRICLAAARL